MVVVVIAVVVVAVEEVVGVRVKVIAAAVAAAVAVAAVTGVRAPAPVKVLVPVPTRRASRGVLSVTLSYRCGSFTVEQHTFTFLSAGSGRWRHQRQLGGRAVAVINPNTDTCNKV